MKKNAHSLPEMIKRYFYEYLPAMRGGSPNTITTYAEAISMFLKYLSQRKKIIPSKISVDDLSVQNIIEFLNYLEKERGNGVSTRNARLAAIRSLVKYLLFEKPEWTIHFHGILSIPTKKTSTAILDYLSQKEMDAILETPSNSWIGNRDRTMFTIMYNTGVRVSEIIGMKVYDVSLERSKTIRVLGKGRKARLLPLWKSTATLVRQWIKSNRFNPDSYLFPSSRGKKMTRSTFAKRLTLTVEQAKVKCKELKSRSVSPHTLRHTMAMHFLQSGVDITVIAMWLGHESIETTHLYIDADMEMKTKALQALQDPNSKSFRYSPSDPLLAMLDEL